MSLLNQTSVREVIIHPLVLLSVADHYHRVAKDTSRRVVGALLGTRSGHTIDVTNSFAVPFEEDSSNPSVWFLDHNYLEQMFWMFKRISTREELVGFYSSGPKVKDNDLKITSLFREHCKNEPIFVVIDVRPGIQDFPTIAYEAVEEIEGEGKEIKRMFQHIPCRIVADDVEEVGVEHLLRDLHDPTTSEFANRIVDMAHGLKGLTSRLEEIEVYLTHVCDGKLPVNNKIIYNLQDILNLLPNLNVDALVSSLMVKSNDFHVAIYIGTLIRSITALHELLNNKIKFPDLDSGLVSSIDDKSVGKTNSEKTPVVPSL